MNKHQLIAHKAKVKVIAHELNKSWSNKNQDWFSVCDVTDAHNDLWGYHNYESEAYDLLSDFHCMDWKHIDAEARAVIAENVVKFLHTPYLVYQHGRFIMYDREAVAAEDARQGEERKRKLAERDSKPRSWLTKLWHKLTDEEL